MADLSITQTEVLPGAGATTRVAIAGAAITPGQTIYIKSSDSKAYLADADLSAAAADCKGIALSEAAEGQYIVYQRGGTITIGSSASVAQGAVYVLSATAGGICPEVDLGTDDYVTYLGVGDDSDGIVLSIHYSGVAHV